MDINVKSETAPLKTVMLHRPGRELEHLSPRTMSQLLFDDIPFLHQARAEHDAFAQLLRDNGVRVLYLEDLAAEAIAVSPYIRELFIREFIAMAGSAAQGYKNELTEFSPMPNLYFTRDPFACIGNGVSIHRMYSQTRQRETIYGKYIFAYHPDLAGKVRTYYSNEMPFSLEGGDILALSPEVIAVGISQRTRPEAIELLAENLFSDPDADFRTVLAFAIPNSRASMHLDTVLTQVDTDKFTVHPGILPTLRIFELTRTGKGSFRTKETGDPPKKVLERFLHLDRVELIKCGGDSDIAANREQWNDGSNTLCVCPGKVLVYDRNYITNASLQTAGIEVIPMNGSELSRGRGGPRCMSMPFFRI